MAARPLEASATIMVRAEQIEFTAMEYTVSRKLVKNLRSDARPGMFEWSARG
jgi:hypothetical protein